MSSGTPGPMRVVVFESRRAAEAAELIRRHGGEPISAPSMREVPLESNAEMLAYVDALEAGEIDVAVLLTGVGLRSLVKQVEAERPPERIGAALRRTTVVARGPKVVAALRELGVQADVTVPEPNTWRELLATLDAEVPLRGRSVSVQEYGVTNRELLSGLEDRGATVRRLVTYAWALPEDVGPLRRGVVAILDRKADAAMFTSANQVYTIFQFAEDEGLADGDGLRRALRDLVVASVGPVCSQTLREFGVEVDVQPEHPKLGPLVAELLRRGKRTDSA